MVQTSRHRSFHQLRKHALEKLKQLKQKNIKESESENTNTELKRLLCELDTYQIELELQNDQLQSTEIELREAHDRMTELYDYAPVGYITLDDNGYIVQCNITFAAMLGHSRSKVLNTPITDFIYREDQDLFYLYFRDMKTAEQRLTQELRFKKFKNPRNMNQEQQNNQNFCAINELYFWAQMDVVVNNPSDNTKTERSYKAIMLDISERKKHEQCIQEQEQVQINLMHDLVYQAAHDGLTGLVNRREFECRLERLLNHIDTSNQPSEHVLCFIDLDQFKIVNDTCGHLAGDELLKQLTHTLSQSMRQRDTFARMGGDEFAILMEHCTLEQAQPQAEYLRQIIEKFRFSWDTQTFKLSASLGIVHIPKKQTDMMQLLSKADQACYKAKETGRNCVHLYNDNDEDIKKNFGEASWGNRIITALENNRFELVWQNIIPTHNTKKTAPHLELLIRMLDKDDSFILPGAFLGAADRFHLAIAIDTWVIRNLFIQLKKSNDFCDHVGMININLSAMSLVSSSFLKLVLAELSNTNIKPEKICFEITETSVITNMDKAVNFMTEIKNRGCKFALDDFGVGLSSFAYLKKLPVDFLKIDGIFVRGIAKNNIDYATVKSINEIGHAMGKKTVAEYVENEETIILLQDIGVDFAQGNYIGKPEPIIAHIERFIQIKLKEKDH